MATASDVLHIFLCKLPTVAFWASFELTIIVVASPIRVAVPLVLGVKMMYKAGSQSLIAKGSSIASLKSLSPSSSVSETGGRRLGHSLSRMQRSSSSLYMQGFSFESSCNLPSTGSSISFSSQVQSSSKLLINSNESQVITDPPTLNEAGGAKFAQYIILLALMIQIPNFFDELMEVIDQHMHSIPLLVMLGVMPSVFWIRGKKGESNPKSQDDLLAIIRRMQSTDLNTGSMLQESSKSDNYNQYHSDIASSKEIPAFEEWGHFAELDESALEEKDVCFILNSSARRRPSGNLGTLTEVAEEEENMLF